LEGRVDEDFNSDIILTTRVIYSLENTSYCIS
jgi:hypothetical protein